MYTIPNLITFIRLGGIPVFVWLLFGLQNRLLAVILLGVIGASDWVDGYLARRLGQESELGRILDPVADRLVILTAIPCLLVDGSAPIIFCLIGLFREVSLTFTVLIMAAFKFDTIKVNWAGKAGTLLLFMAFPLFLLSNSDVPSGVESTSVILAWSFGIPGLILSYTAVRLYIPEVRNQIRNRHSKT